jgi:hypothetical protein
MVLLFLFSIWFWWKVWKSQLFLYQSIWDSFWLDTFIGFLLWPLFLCCIQFGCLWDYFNQTLHTVSFREIHSIAKERSRFLVWFMPCPFTGPKMFCAGPNVLCWSKCFVLVQMCWASPKIWLHLVPLQKLLCRHKNQFYWILHVKFQILTNFYFSWIFKLMVTYIWSKRGAY